jgi:hypothetical protein
VCYLVLGDRDGKTLFLLQEKEGQAEDAEIICVRSKDLTRAIASSYQLPRALARGSKPAKSMRPLLVDFLHPLGAGALLFTRKKRVTPVPEKLFISEIRCSRHETLSVFYPRPEGRGN